MKKLENVSEPPKPSRQIQVETKSSPSKKSTASSQLNKKKMNEPKPESAKVGNISEEIEPASAATPGHVESYDEFMKRVGQKLIEQLPYLENFDDEKDDDLVVKLCPRNLFSMQHFL